MLILFKAFHTLHIVSVEFNRFPELSRTSGLFPDFPVLEDARIKFQDFLGFPGPEESCEKHSRRICQFQANLRSFNTAPVEIDKD